MSLLLIVMVIFLLTLERRVYLLLSTQLQHLLLYMRIALSIVTLIIPAYSIQHSYTHTSNQWHLGKDVIILQR